MFDVTNYNESINKKSSIFNAFLSLVVKVYVTEDDFLEYPTDPQEIYKQYHHKVDLIIDGGYGGNIASTIIDCTGDSPVLNRKGLGEWLED
jgi:hypothetical protein